MIANRQGVLAGLAMVLFASSSEALTILARCGPSKGESYYFEGGLVPPGRGGWRNDGFDEGRITAWIDDKGRLDIILKDAGGTRSYLSENIKVEAQGVDAANRSFLITASGKNFVETFLFKTNEAGAGSLIWTSSKTTPSFVKSSVMQAECGPEFAIEPNRDRK